MRFDKTLCSFSCLYTVQGKGTERILYFPQAVQSMRKSGNFTPIIQLQKYIRPALKRAEI